MISTYLTILCSKLHVSQSSYFSECTNYQLSSVEICTSKVLRDETYGQSREYKKSNRVTLINPMTPVSP